jgi:hypothetical protein
MPLCCRIALLSAVSGHDVFAPIALPVRQSKNLNAGSIITSFVVAPAFGTAIISYGGSVNYCSIQGGQAFYTFQSFNSTTQHLPWINIVA